MADKTVTGGGENQDIPRKWHDNADGTYSPTVYDLAGGGGGGGGAVTVADGADVAQGTTTDLSSASTVVGILKNLKAALAGTLTVGLPSGASTAAKQPALGTAGTASADVITVQGKSGMTPIDISGSVTASGSIAVTNAGTFAVQADSEFPAAAALGDTDANPTTTQVGSALQGWTGTVWARLKAGIGDGAGATGFLNIVGMMFNGATYDRMRGDSTNGLDVDVTRLPALVAGSATIGALTANQSVNGTQWAGTAVDVNSGSKSAGTLRVTLATDQVQLTNALKVDGSAVTQPVSGTVTATTELSTGLTTFSNTALTNTKTAVKASAGKVYGWMIHNPSAATTYIQVWNVAIGSITVGTTAPTYTIPLPTGASANVFTDRGITHSTEINIAATTTPTGSTAPASAAVVSIFYI